VTFDNPPINLIDPVMIIALHDLLAEIEQDNRVAVVVFDSADADFFLAHYDIATDRSAFNALPAARTPFHHWANLLIRLSRSRAVTISALRGRARGAGSEFVLATDIRFASRERAVLGQFEVGFAAVPGGGPSTRLPGMVGRGGHSKFCSVARTSTGISPSGMATSTAPFPTRSSLASSMPSRSGSRALTCSRWPTSSASSTLRRFPPLPL
jgi:enoyl-CoA hydratase/carnithine racemase